MMDDVKRELAKIDVQQIVAEGWVVDFCEKYQQDSAHHLAWMKERVGTMVPTIHDTMVMATWENLAGSVVFNLMSDFRLLYGDDEQRWPGQPLHKQWSPPMLLGIPANPDARLEPLTTETESQSEMQAWIDAELMKGLLEQMHEDRGSLSPGQVWALENEEPFYPVLLKDKPEAVRRMVATCPPNSVVRVTYGNGTLDCVVIGYSEADADDETEKDCLIVRPRAIQASFDGEGGHPSDQFIPFEELLQQNNEGPT